MTGFVVTGTDTDAGKTTFSLLFLAAFAEQFGYWKPVETGDPDSLRVRRLVPTATVHEPLARFREPVAPALAAQREGRTVPGVADILTARPTATKPLLIETFGSPLSPLTDDVLQIELIRELRLPLVLITPSAVGAIGRTLAAVRAMTGAGVRTTAVVLMGPPDEYAAEQIEKHTGLPVVSARVPDGEWTPELLRATAEEQRTELDRLRAVVSAPSNPLGTASPPLTRRDGWQSQPAATSPPPVRGRGVAVAEPQSNTARVPTEARAVFTSPPPCGGEVDAARRFPPIVSACRQVGIPTGQAAGEGELHGSQGNDATPHAPSQKLVARDRAAVWHPYTALTGGADPLPVIAAEREFLHLADGRTLIDAVSSWWTILHGHRHPPLVAALTTAAQTLDHVLFAGVTHPPAVELAELMLASTPWTGGRVFYSDNGSTAVEVALKMAYQYWCHRGEPERTLFAGFENGYHGDTFGAMAVGRDPLFFGTFEPLLFRALQVPVSAEQLDAALTANAGKVAAVILEPLVQGAGGMRMHTPEELRAIFDVTRRHGVLFIADEVMTGCRTGDYWAHTCAGIVPDLICTAKTLAGGMLPLAATLAAPRVVAAFDTPDRTKTFFHGHSFTANPLACAVAVENWKGLASGTWKADAARIEAFWRTHLEPLRGQPGVKDVRIRGTIGAVELDVPGGYLAEIGPRIRARAISAGVLLRPLGSVVYAMPPLGTTDESLARIAAAIRASVIEGG